jgi:hypothetical protein
MSESSDKNTWCHPMEGEMFGVGALCSKPNSEHLDTLRVVAEPVSSLRKSSPAALEVERLDSVRNFL